MKAFMKFYLPFRYVVILMGSLPGILVLWPLAIFLLSAAPVEVGEALLGSVDWIISNVFLVGEPEEFGNLRYGLAFVFPSVIAIAIIFIENITGLFVFVERERERKEAY